MTDAERISRFARVHPELAELVVTAATLGGHSIKWLRGESKARDLVGARLWVVKRARPRFSYSEIGRALNRDRATVRHHAKTVCLGIEPRRGRPAKRQLELLA